MSYNQVIVEGFVAKDSELRFTPNGKAVLSFSIAVDSGLGEMKETVWINCSLWGERGEKMQKFILKGTSMLVTGRFKPVHVYEKDGKHVGSVQMDVNDISFTGRKPQTAEPTSF